MPSYSDPNELLTQVSDDDTVVIGPVARRSVHGNPDLIHRSTHVLVIHPDNGTLLLQKRSAAKDTFPGHWDTSVGGHVTFGQTYEEAAVRETEEELGISVTPADLIPLYPSRFRGSQESENTLTFLCLHRGPFVANPEEIDALRFWTRSEIVAALGTGAFTPHFEAEFAAFVGSPRGSLLQ